MRNFFSFVFVCLMMSATVAGCHDHHGLDGPSPTPADDAGTPLEADASVGSCVPSPPGGGDSCHTTERRYADRDGDGHGDPGDWIEVGVCCPWEGEHTLPWIDGHDNDCDDTNADVYPGAPELLDGIDNDCDGEIESRRRHRFCEPWLMPGPGVSEELVEAFGYRGCCVDGGEFSQSDAAEPGMFVKATTHTVYYIASDHRRYVFPSSHHLASWFVDASRPYRFGHDPAACEAVVQIPDALLASIPLGGNAPVRPGLLTMALYTRDVYATDRGNVLRVLDRSVLGDLDRLHFVEPWLEGRGVIIHDSIFPSHHLGEPVTAESEYDGERIYREATLEEEIRLMNER